MPLEQEDRSTAPFNMALRTLEKIHNILTQITIVSVVPTSTEMSYVLSLGKNQHSKYALVRQLYIQSIPLLDKKKNLEWKPIMYGRIKNLKKRLMTASIYDQGRIIKIEERYDDELDMILDDITVEIQERLQEEGYFMPPKDDARFSWKEG